MSYVDEENVEMASHHASEAFKGGDVEIITKLQEGAHGVNEDERKICISVLNKMGVPLSPPTLNGQHREGDKKAE